MAVKPDQREPRLRVPLAKFGDRRGMEPGQLTLDRGDRADPAQDRAQPLAERRRVGDGQRRTGRDIELAVADDRRDIDTVERGAAHQPQRGHPIRAR